MDSVSRHQGATCEWRVIITQEMPEMKNGSSQHIIASRTNGIEKVCPARLQDFVAR